MNLPPPDSLDRVPSRSAWIYAAAAAAWVVLSNLAVALAGGHAHSDLWVDIGKGMLFVVVSAGLLYLLLARQLAREQAVRQDLAGSQARFNSAVTQLPFIFAIYDSDRRFRFLNARGLLETGKALGEVLGRRDEEVFPLERVNAYLPALLRALETRQPQTEVVDIPTPAGHTHLAYTFTPLLAEDGTVREVLGVTNDMTAVVRNDRHVRRLNRTLQAVSEANSVLVRAPDETTLLQQFCATLTQHTGHGLVWVGFNEPSGALRVMVRVGNPAGFLDTIPLSCGQSEQRNFCVPEAALRSGEPAVCGDFQTDERFGNCRAWALAAGLRSAISLPLRAGDEVFGVLSLYSTEPGRFDAEEIKLLGELADDLAYGLAAQRSKGKLQQALSELQTSGEQLRLLKQVVEQSAVVAYVSRPGPDWAVEFVSENVTRYGYQAVEFTSGQRPFPSVVHPADWPEMVAATERELLAGTNEYSLEYRILDAQGEPHWMRDTCTVVRSAASQPLQFRGVLTDITERKQAEDALRASEEKFRAYVEQAADAVFVHDFSGRFLEVNRRACESLGYSRSELLCLSVSDVDIDFDLAHAQAEWQRIPNGESATLLGRHRRKDGTNLPVEVRFGCFKLHGECRYLALARDITERKQAEDTLRASEGKFRALFENSLDGIMLTTTDGGILAANPAACRMLGRSEAEICRAGRAGIVDPTDLRLRGLVEERTRTGRVSGELRLVRADGTCFEAEVSSTVFHTPAGERTSTLVRDLTAQRQAAGQIRDALGYLGTLIEASPLGIRSFDHTGQTQAVNEAAARMVGGTVEQLLAQNFRDIPVWKTNGMAAIAERALANRRSERLEAHFTTTFGKEVWLAMQFVPFQRADGWHLLLLMVDISEQAKAAAQLQLQSTALEAAANAIVITDLSGAILWVNAAFTRTTGYTFAEAVGQNPRLLKSGRHPREYYEGMWKTILGGHVWHGEMHNRRKDGTPLEEDATITPVKNAQGVITHFIAIKQDITDKKTLEKQFLRAQRMESIGLLAGGIAHDLNNVLAPILMGAEMLKLFTQDAEMTRQLDNIMQSAERGAGIVKQVLTFARGIEGERVVLHPRHILKEMARLVRETFPRNVQLGVDVPNELWPVLGDPTQLHQVLLNLCVNARDAMPDGGELSLSARSAEVDLALAQANPGAKPGPHVLLRVRDTGTGIPPAVMERIWEPFFSTKEVGKGTGLGLPTVLGIVRSHGGFIVVESEIGRGTTFDIYLPAAPQAVEPVAAANPDPLPLGKGELILMVDDEPDLVSVTRNMLERHGYRVLTAGDGTGALAQVSDHKGELRLVITDILMPFMDGVQFIRALRRLTPGMPVIASSGALGLPGHQDRTDEVRALGVKQILRKPYGVESLLRSVHAALHEGEALPPA